MSKGGAPKGNKNHFKHGLSHTRIDNIYKNMISRCYYSKNSRYERYGKRGIKVCDEWKNDKTLFFEWAFNNGYSENLSLDRIDTDGDYSPNNCRWADVLTQQNNKSTNHNITVNNETHSLAEWERRLNLTAGTLWNKLNRGMSEEELIAWMFSRLKIA